MTWTVICMRDGQTSAQGFHHHPNAEEALKNICDILEPDGYQVVALLKGDHVAAFYGVDISAKEIVTND